MTYVQLTCFLHHKIHRYLRMEFSVRKGSLSYVFHLRAAMKSKRLADIWKAVKLVLLPSNHTLGFCLPRLTEQRLHSLFKTLPYLITLIIIIIIIAVIIITIITLFYIEFEITSTKYTIRIILILVALVWFNILVDSVSLLAYFLFEWLRLWANNISLFHALA